MHSEIDNKKQRISRFDSWTEYLAYLETPFPSTTPKQNCKSLKASKSSDWSGTCNFAEALALARNGWLEGAEAGEKTADALFTRISHLIERQDMTYDVEGIGIDIARYLDGEPECWQKWEQSIVDGSGTKIVKILFNVSAAGGVPTAIIEAKGSMIVALVELLEYAGNRCEVHLGFGSISGSLTQELTVKIKAADQPLNSPRLAFAMAHPASLRRLVFNWIEHMQNNWKEFQSSYGQPLKISDKIRQEFDIYIPETSFGDRNWKDESVARAFIIATLKEQGLTLSEKS